MINTRRIHVGISLTMVALLGCSPMAAAADTSEGQSSNGGTTITTPAIVGLGSPTFVRDEHGFVGNIEDLSRQNQDFRKVLYTSQHTQLVIMALKPGEDIGAEVHPNVDQFLRVEEGSGEAVLANVHHPIHAGYAVLVPAGTKHNIVNTGKSPMTLYTLYSPPQHRDGIIQHTRAEAEQSREHFDGVTTR